MANNNEGQGNRVNYQIKTTRVLVVHNGNKLGEMHIKSALAKAESFDLDLVEIASQSRPPVCIIVDYGKWRYDQSKKEKQSQANSVKSEVKTIRLRQNTEDHDVETKLKLIKKFLGSGKKVHIQIRSKGRELAHKDRGLEIANKIIKDVIEIGKPDSKPKMMGNEISFRIGPL